MNQINSGTKKAPVGAYIIFKISVMQPDVNEHPAVGME